MGRILNVLAQMFFSTNQDKLFIKSKAIDQ